MRRLVPLVTALVVAAGTAPSSAPARTPAKPKLLCAKGTKVQRDVKRRLVACVSTTPPTEAKLLAALQHAARAGLGRRARTGKGPRVSAREVEALTRRGADPTKPRPGLLARAQSVFDGPADRHTHDDRTDSDTAVWVQEDGTEREFWWHDDTPEPGQVGDYIDVRSRFRDPHAGGRSMILLKDDRFSRCPTATGDIAGTFAYGIGIGLATYAHGKRTWSETSFRIESPLTGRVGVDAKADTFDLDLRGSMETRGWVEHAGTGRLLKHIPTRTLRIAYAAQRVPVHADVQALAKQLVAGARLRGPHGAAAKSQAELDNATQLMDAAMVALHEMQQRFVEGDKRWYDQRACAKLDVKTAPAKLRKGDTATWDVAVQAADGTPVSKTSPWTVRSACDGTLTANQVDGTTGHFEVGGGDWSLDPDRHACLNGELTTPAGRPPVLHDPIFAEDPPKGYRFTVHVDYTANMGPGIAGTEVHADGTASDEPGDGSTEGSGQWSGVEWDGTLTNPCGADMQRTRTIGGPVIVGAEIHDDGTATIALTATERPLDFSWIVVVPVTGGSETIASSRPFCGEPGLAQTQAVVTVKSEPLER